MSRLFTRASSEFGTFDGIGGLGTYVAQRSFAVSLWFRCNVAAQRQAILADWNSGGVSQSFVMCIGASAAPTAGEFRIGIGANGDASTGITILQNKWYHVFYTWNAVNNLTTTVLNGVVILGPAAPVAAISAGTTLAVGRGGAFNGLYLGGDVADLAIWSDQRGGGLPVGHWVDLARGVSPTMIRPEFLKLYAPLHGIGREPVYGFRGGLSSQNITWTGTKGSANPNGFKAARPRGRRRLVAVR